MRNECGCEKGVVLQVTSHCGGHAYPESEDVTATLLVVYNKMLSTWHTEECYRKYAYNGSGCICGRDTALSLLREILNQTPLLHK